MFRKDQKDNRTILLPAIGVASIFIYWLVYFWQDSLSNAGDYRFFSYIFHELWSSLKILVFPMTLIWLVHLLFQAIRTHDWKNNFALLMVLAILTVFQIYFFCMQSNLVNTTAFDVEIIEIVDEYHIVIENNDCRLTLETIPIVTTLLRTDGTKYCLHYIYSVSNPNQGRLVSVLNVKE